MKFSRPVSDVITVRSSCRSYREEPIEAQHRKIIEDILHREETGPFGNVPRFILVASSPGDGDALRGLGTYGFIKNPAAFIVGAVKNNHGHLEDYGYVMEKFILRATDIGIGSCWLGGSFKKSSFADKISPAAGEAVPAVVSLGYGLQNRTLVDSLVRFSAGSKKRKPWEEIFFHGKFSVPLSGIEAGDYAGPLEMLRRAPSASNKQPWRIVRVPEENIYHFFLERSSSYKISLKLIRAADLQRVDMGIGMCHFELTAREQGLRGIWKTTPPENIPVPAGTEYIVTWRGE
ncbi:MAG TPA: nitroreductase family protein [Spirochaetota bacterium]|nr:nitroreductase family protein [Spirochaetota bacterium]HQO03497.1 nitroreductase family protein [Spirochaetota bacterium]HQP48847.1 nitroreductase family protein [Spirochaetota bacterium]